MYVFVVDAHRQITWRVILQPEFTQSHDYKDFDETSVYKLRQYAEKLRQQKGSLNYRGSVLWTRFPQKSDALVNYHADRNLELII